MPSIKHTLAITFAEHLAAAVTAEQLDEIASRNEAETDERICHSHDFCDANQVMIDALAEHGLSYDTQDDEQRAAVEAAWSIAKASHFDRESILRNELHTQY